MSKDKELRLNFDDAVDIYGALFTQEHFFKDRNVPLAAERVSKLRQRVGRIVDLFIEESEGK